MTLRENRIADEVEKTLQAYDHDPVLEANPFLLTRIRSDMAQTARAQPWASATAVRTGVIFMAFIIVLNLVTLSHSLTVRFEKTVQQQLIQQLQTELHFDQAETLY